MSDLSNSLKECIRDAQARNIPLQIVGYDTKHFLGRQPKGNRVEVSAHAGIVSYEPTELSLTVKSGSLISDVQNEVKKCGQHLAFEPPDFDSKASIGGTIACGLSGPARPYQGSLRDFLLGITCINGRGELLRFGGRVMKNVAGYDVSRLMAGSMGTLGVILDASFKVLPLPEAEQTQVYEVSEETALLWMSEWNSKALPISATCFFANQLHVRFSGHHAGVAAAVRDCGGAHDAQGKHFWSSLREQNLPYFKAADVMWRLVVPSATAPLGIGSQTLIDWGGGQRWLVGDHDEQYIRKVIRSVGGHATRFRGGDRNDNVNQPLESAAGSLHRKIKRAFDPAGILNPGRLYEGL